MDVDPFGRICGEIWNITHQDCPVVNWEWPCHYPPDSFGLESVPEGEEPVLRWRAKLWPVWRPSPDFMPKWYKPVPEYPVDIALLFSHCEDIIRKAGMFLEIGIAKDGEWSVKVWSSFGIANCPTLIGYAKKEDFPTAILMAMRDALVFVSDNEVLASGGGENERSE